jgi:hypothetical protein
MWTGKNGVNSRQDFLNNHQAQNDAVNAFNNKNWGYIKGLKANGRSLASYEGETVCGVKLTKGAMIAAAHGHGVGNLQKFIQSCHIHRDGNGVPITHTMNQFQNFDMSSCIK